MNWFPTLLVMFGGAIGSALRFTMSRACITHFSHWHFPIGTLAVNVIGSFIIGFLSVLLISRWPVQEESLRLFLMVGILGGFTTFSSFSLETISLFYEDYAGRAILYILLSLTLGLLSTWIGIILGKLSHA